MFNLIFSAGVRLMKALQFFILFAATSDFCFSLLKTIRLAVIHLIYQSSSELRIPFYMLGNADIFLKKNSIVKKWIELFNTNEFFVYKSPRQNQCCVTYKTMFLSTQRQRETNMKPSIMKSHPKKWIRMIRHFCVFRVNNSSTKSSIKSFTL